MHILSTKMNDNNNNNQGGDDDSPKTSAGLKTPPPPRERPSAQPYTPIVDKMTVDQQREFFRKKGQRRREERKANVRQVIVDVDEYVPPLLERNCGDDCDSSSSSSDGDASFSGINNLDFQAGDW